MGSYLQCIYYLVPYTDYQTLSAHVEEVGPAFVGDGVGDIWYRKQIKAAEAIAGLNVALVELVVQKCLLQLKHYSHDFD